MRKAEDETGRGIRGGLHFEENAKEDERWYGNWETTRRWENDETKGEPSKKKIGNLTVGVHDTSEISGTEALRRR